MITCYCLLYLESPQGDAFELAVEDVELADGIEVESERRDPLQRDGLQHEAPVHAHALEGLAGNFEITNLFEKRNRSEVKYFFLLNFESIGLF